MQMVNTRPGNARTFLIHMFGRNRELGISLDGHIAGKGIRKIAEELHRGERVAVDRGPDSGLRPRTRRLVGKACQRAGGGRAMPRGNSP